MSNKMRNLKEQILEKSRKLESLTKDEANNPEDIQKLEKELDCLLYTYHKSTLIEESVEKINVS